MIRKTMFALGALALLVPASAGAQGVTFPNDESKALSECVVLSTTGRDRLLLIRWIAVSIGAAKSMQDAITVKPGAKEDADRNMGVLFTRLFTVDCRNEAMPLLKGNDNAGVEAAFGELGRIAMNELIGDPQVEQSLTSFVQYADLEAVAELAK
ncbi:hypothetical protein [uncultured Erythrobacter sp.]|uniref:hypothetical protein n=1 Tax=uncultured Erythrobacter sp. TaxID=263913 RepID=UPI0026585F1C|nr:hypothetical protein [uncultured Erythrobacter sp.]